MKYLPFILLILFACKKKQQGQSNTNNPPAPVVTCTPVAGFQDIQWRDETNPSSPQEIIIFKTNSDFVYSGVVKGNWVSKGCDTLFVTENSLPNKFFYKVLFKNDTIMKTVWKNNYAGDTTRRWQTFKKLH